jgi:RNA polymerase sigma-70 factor (ECF subfamily)
VSVNRPADDGSDEELPVRAADDPGAFEALYLRHFDATVAFAVRRCVRAEEVHDLVAAVWLEVIRAASRFDPERGRALPWIFGVAANLVADQRRRAARERDRLDLDTGRAQVLRRPMPEHISSDGEP